MNRPQIIALTGSAGSGKDVVASYLELTHGYRHYKFSEPLKRMIATLLGVPYEDIEAMKHRVFHGFTVRKLMQTLGTEWGRDTIDSEFWVNQFVEDYERHPVPTVISDLRFNNEAEQVCEMGGEVVQIIRPDANSVEAHSSEDGINPDLIDATVINSSDIETLLHSFMFAVGMRRDT